MEFQKKIGLKKIIGGQLVHDLIESIVVKDTFLNDEDGNLKQFTSKSKFSESIMSTAEKDYGIELTLAQMQSYIWNRKNGLESVRALSEKMVLPVKEKGYALEVIRDLIEEILLNPDFFKDDNDQDKKFPSKTQLYNFISSIIKDKFNIEASGLQLYGHVGTKNEQSNRIAGLCENFIVSDKILWEEGYDLLEKALSDEKFVRTKTDLNKRYTSKRSLVRDVVAFIKENYNIKLYASTVSGWFYFKEEFFSLGEKMDSMLEPDIRKDYTFSEVSVKIYGQKSK